MLFFPENPELLFLYLYHLRLQEAEQAGRGQEAPGDQTGLSAKVRMAYEKCLVQTKRYSARLRPGSAADSISGELGKLPH